MLTKKKQLEIEAVTPEGWGRVDPDTNTVMAGDQIWLPNCSEWRVADEGDIGSSIANYYYVIRKED